MTPPSQATEPFFLWTSAFHVGDGQLDQEHWILGERLNQLHEALKVHRNKAAAEQILQAFLQETRVHFVHEEQRLLAANYPDSEAHIAQHSKLLAELQDMVNRHQQGAVSSLVLLGFLKDWLVWHLQQSDRKYVAHIRSGFI